MFSKLLFTVEQYFFLVERDAMRLIAYVSIILIM